LSKRPSGKKKDAFHALLNQIRGKKADLKNEQDAQAIMTALKGAAYVVESVKSKEAQRRPSAPFTTSTLQQEASRKLNFTARKTTRAQEAHEAIRPTLAARDPENLKRYLSSEQYRLYKLIWQRFIASQMANAVLDQTTVDVGAGKPTDPAPKPYTFRATGSVI